MKPRLIRLCAVALLVLTAMGGGATYAQSANMCPMGESPGFQAGLATLKETLADWQGDPVTCAYLDPSGSGDFIQNTTTGVARYRAADRVWMFTNGFDYWALTADGVIYWAGGPEIPEDAVAATPNPCLEMASCAQPPPPIAFAPATPSTPVATGGAEVIVQTSKGPKRESELRSELEKAGYAGPWDTTSMLQAYERATSFGGVSPYESDTRWSCLRENPSCGREIWYLERNELVSKEMVRYAAVGPNFQSERTFIEAINLIWQFPRGKALLKTANDASVTMISLAYDRETAFATYLPDRNTITYNDRILRAPTWMVADVLLHELVHASDDHNRLLGNSYQDCIAAEIRAFQGERDFLTWLTRTLQPAGLPSLGVLQGSLSNDVKGLAASLYETGFSSTLGQDVAASYEHVC